MKRATITLPNDLAEALEAYQRDQEVPPPLTAVAQVALVAHTWLHDLLRGAALVNPTVDDYMAATARVAQYRTRTPFEPISVTKPVQGSVRAKATLQALLRLVGRPGEADTVVVQQMAALVQTAIVLPLWEWLKRASP